VAAMEAMFSKALIAHIIGDWLFNTAYLRKRKQKEFYILILHVLITSLPFVVLGFSLAQILFIAISHAIIDGFRLGYWWSRLIGNDEEKLYAQQMDDQAFHLIAIWTILQMR